MIAQQIEVTIEPRKAAPTPFDEFFSAVADAFYLCDGIFDQDLSGNAESGSLTFSMGVTAEDPVEAFRVAMTAVRATMHAIGAGTPGWEDHIQVGMRQVEQGATTVGLVPA